MLDKEGSMANIINMFGYTTIAKLIITAAPYVSIRKKYHYLKCILQVNLSPSSKDFNSR